MNVDALAVLDQLPLKGLGVVDVDAPSGNGEELRKLCGTEASRSCNNLGGSGVGPYGDGLDEAVGADALGQLLQLPFIEGAAGVGGGLVDGVDGHVLEFAAVLQGGSPWVWLRWLRLRSEYGFPVRSRSGKGLGVLCLPLLLEGFCEALRTEIAVPRLGEGNVQLEERTMKRVVGAGDEP